MFMVALILTHEAARILAVSSDTVRRWERTGRLPAVKTSGGVRVFDRADVERLAAERGHASQQLGGLVESVAK